MNDWTRYWIASVTLIVVLVLTPTGISALAGSIVINNGNAYVASPSVTLTLSASDGTVDISGVGNGVFGSFQGRVRISDRGSV